MSAKRQIVTIDGPSGVGKSSVSRVVAAELGYTYLDTGAMYRGVGLYFHSRNINIEDEERVSPLLSDIQLQLLAAHSVDEDVGVLLNDEDVSEQIRTPELSMVASKISDPYQHARVESEKDGGQRDLLDLAKAWQQATR